MPWRKVIVVAALMQILSGLAFAQDRPLLEPLRIGYVQAELIVEGLRNSASLEQALRRKGFVPTWREFTDGIAAVRALDAGDVDLTLVIPLDDVVAAKRENLKMVFIAELRSIAPSCCNMEQIFADHMFKRYTLSGEYLADYREDALLILHQEMIKVLQRYPGHYASKSMNPESTTVTRDDWRHSPGAARLGPVTRDTMQEASNMAHQRLPAGKADNATDVTDINYWMPSHY